jgi:D-lactate dehydrogenase
MDIYFYEAFEEEAKALQSYMPPQIRAGYTWKTIQESGDSTPPAKIISVRTQSHLPLEWGGHLDGILSRSTGYDHLIAYRNACDADPALGYLPLYCNRSVAEQAALLWMACLRKLELQRIQFREFQRDGLTGSECRGKRLLVVGVGNIGSEIVHIGRGLEMEVRGVDIVEKFSDVTYIGRDEGIAWADIICCSMNLTKANAGYFSYDLLKRSKRGIIFINIARGELSPCTGLLKLVEEDHIAGLALDVYNHESELAVSLREGRPSKDPEVQTVHALTAYPNVIMTPHNAFNTEEAVQTKSEHSVRQLIQLMKQGRFEWPVPAE